MVGVRGEKLETDSPSRVMSPNKREQGRGWISRDSSIKKVLMIVIADARGRGRPEGAVKPIL